MGRIIIYGIFIIAILIFPQTTNPQDSGQAKRIITLIDSIMLENDSTASYSNLNELMKLANGSPELLQFSLETAEQRLFYNNSSHNSDLFVTILQKANLNILDNAYSDYWTYQLELAQRNRVGTQANDIQFTLPDGKPQRLYGIKSQYIVLFFNNPDCDECKQTKLMFMATNIPENVKIVSIYPDNNEELWKSSLTHTPDNWINGIDKELVVDSEQTYVLRTTPTLYLLDSHKKVILKDASPTEIIRYLSELAPD